MKKKKMPILLEFVAFLFDCKIEIRKIPFSTNITYTQKVNWNSKQW